MIYLIGSLRNPHVLQVADILRHEGFEVFDDWMAAGPEADDRWKDYEQARGRTYVEALQGHAARNVFQFDKANLDRATTVILVAPAGKSGHLELGYSLGRGRRGYYLLDTPDRWDVMLQFCTLVTDSLQEIIKYERDILASDTQPHGPAMSKPQVGQEVPRDGNPSVNVVEGPINSDWCCNCGLEPRGCICRVQRLSQGDARR